MVQRYLEDGFGLSEMNENEEGDWVKYEDYVALVDSVETLHNMIKTGHMTVEHISGFLEGILLVVQE